MKLYQKFLTKILLTHRSTLHNTDTIYNKKKKKLHSIELPDPQYQKVN